MTVRHKLIGASLLALTATSAFAQTAATATGSEDTDTIIVTGYRASLEASIDAKRKLNVIADVITAEDIGKFPDRNVAESLQRVPGIVINREFGEGERVSLRGTAPNLTQTLLNGSHIATADWFVLEQLSATRSFNYLMLPSDIVARLEVYKSPTAALEEGGIGGTINVITRKPLDLEPFSFSASAQAVYSDRSKKTNPQGSALISWHNADETFGVLVAGVYQKREIRRDGVEVLGYFAPPVTTPGANPGDPAIQTLPAGTPAGTLVPSLIGSALFRQERERIGGNATIQFKPTDSLEVNLTGLYSRFNADNFNQNYLAWGSQALNNGGTLTNGTISNNAFVKGTITSTPTGRAMVYDAIDRLAKTTTKSLDLDIAWHPSENSLVHLKGGWTKADGNTDSQPFYEAGAPGGFTYDLTGGVPKVSFIGIDPTNPASSVFDFGSLHRITSADEEKYIYADYTYDLDAGPLQAISVGGKFTDHDRETTFFATTFGGFFAPLQSGGCGGPCTPANFAGGPQPSDFLANLGGAGVLRQFYSIDRKKLEQIYFAQPAANRARVLLPGSNFTVNEKTYGGYAMAKLGGDGWSGNAGVRVVRTDQTSSGQVQGVPASTPGAVTTNPFGVYLQTTVERSYTDILPSVNLSFDVTPQLKIRVAAARTVTRPDYTDIVPAVSLNPGSRTGSGGNPFVDPYRANQFDASFEWNAGRRTFGALALYYKDILSYIVNRSLPGQIYPIEIPASQAGGCTLAGTAAPGGGASLYNCPFAIDVRSNGGGGRNIGFEFQAQHAFENGFGASVNYTYSDAKSNAGDPIPGNSKHSFNVTGFYENELFAARLSYNYRSPFFINIDRASPLNQDKTASLDASASINVTHNVSLTADAVNLTNVKIRQYAGTRALPRGIYDNGRQFYVGARVKF